MRLAFAAFALLTSMTALADTPIQPVVRWTLLDQHEQAYTLDDKAQVLLVARSMSAARMVNAAFEDQAPGYLDARQVIYVADIEMMPSLMKPVIIPAMRSAKYRILLDQDGRVAARYAGDRDSVQWLKLDKGVVTQEKHFTDAEGLGKAVAELAR
ncbi:hypothetical protein [Pseudomonas ovata]|uniref:hypothetical protein n=1 Tax=Pseudomonas ovata TaxID=1839709 RepID=UPI000D693643|nr:hypothetical protein [Pseudomonas ovata]